MNKEFNNERVYGDSDKYMKTKNKYKFSRQKNTKRKCIIQIFVIYNARSCYKVDKRYRPHCKYEIKNNRMENLINDDFDSSSSDNEFDNDESID